MTTKDNDTEFNEDSRLEYISPLLTKLQETPLVFKEPEGYFEKLREEVSQKIKEESPKSKGILRKLIQPKYAIAAMLIAAVSIIGLTYFNDVRSVKPLTHDEIAEIVYSEKIQNMDEDVLIEAMDSDAINDAAIVEEESIPDEAIVEYLLENDIDLDMISEL